MTQLQLGAEWTTCWKRVDLCAPQEDMRCLFALMNDATYPLATNQSELDAENNKSIPGAPDPQGHMWKGLRG